MATYSSLLTLAKEVKKKTVNENLPIKSRTMDQNRGKRSRSRSPRQSKKNKATNKKEEEIYIDWDIPDRQYGDLYCKPCDSHMNSEQMWEAHIQGKRHLRTVKKGETADLKYDYVDEDPIMIKQLNEESRPIVGLQHLVEIQRLEQRPMYQCFLCSGNVPTPELLLEHIVGTKHRLAYLKEHDPDRYNLIKTSNLKKGHIEPVVEECIQKHENDEGRGKMRVKREKVVSGFEKERSYNYDYSHSRAPKAKNFKSQPSKAKSFKNNDFDSLSGSTNKSYRNKDWDCGRSTHSDKSYDGFPDDFGRGVLKDKKSDYYKRSPDRLESHNRSSYPARHSPDLLSPDNDYWKKMEKNRVVDERYGYPRHTPEKEPYGSSRASEYEHYNSVPQTSDIHRPRSALDDRFGDLREILEKKKTSADLYSRETVSSNHSFFPKSDFVARGTSTFNPMPDIPDSFLEMIEAMSPSVFLRLAYFKVNRLAITTELELKLLDKLSSRITALSMEIKASQLPTNLQDQFKETMVKSGLAFNPQFTKDFEQMMEMVGQVKASSNVEGGNSTRNYPDPHISQPSYSTPTYVSSDMASNSGVQYTNNRDYAPQTTNQTLWQHVDSNASPAANSTTYGSSSSYIPGLTITNNQSNDTTPSYTSPFDVLSNYTKDILGGVRSKTDSHRY